MHIGLLGKRSVYFHILPLSIAAVLYLPETVVVAFKL